jgi:hypothetical protein
MLGPIFNAVTMLPDFEQPLWQVRLTGFPSSELQVFFVNEAH